jgi:hypothetical protein
VRRVYLRVAAIALAAVAVIAALTVYFSSEKIPPCLASGVPKWRPPTDRQVHRFELVVPDRAVCFYDIDHDQALVGALKLHPIEGVTAIETGSGGRLALRYGAGRGALVDLRNGRIRYGVAPPAAPKDEVAVADPQRRVVYSTRRDVFGFRVFDPASFRERKVGFPSFAWNRRFGPNPPDHGLSLAPDRPELWVLDAPNNVVHVFDVRGVPAKPPRYVKDIRFTKPLIGDENPCASHRCTRIGSLQHSADGRFVYVGDVGDVIDTERREEIANLAALRESRLTIEVDWVGGKPSFPAKP